MTDTANENVKSYFGNFGPTEEPVIPASECCAALDLAFRSSDNSRRTSLLSRSHRHTKNQGQPPYGLIMFRSSVAAFYPLLIQFFPQQSKSTNQDN